jgi:hypothetical protein
MILSLFREWVAARRLITATLDAHPDDDREFEAACV